jgi:hypothetical protein
VHALRILSWRSGPYLRTRTRIGDGLMKSRPGMSAAGGRGATGVSVELSGMSNVAALVYTDPTFLRNIPVRPRPTLEWWEESANSRTVNAPARLLGDEIEKTVQIV